MSQISVKARPMTWAEYESPSDPIPWAGSFHSETSDAWDIEFLESHIRPDFPKEDDGPSPGRLFHTPSGRWVLTIHGHGECCYLTVDMARAILTHNDADDAVLEYIDRPRDREGRPEIGPEVKTRLPQATIGAVDELAGHNGLSRAAQLRALVMDSLPGRTT